MLLQPGLAQIVSKRTAVALFPKRPPTCLITQRKNILGLTLADLKTVLSITKWPVYRAYQIYSFLYRQRGTKWKDAENIPKDLRADLEDEWAIDMGRREKAVISEDGTSKLVFNFDPKCRVESVLIPAEDRVTLCVSSQAGCSLACTFCHTGMQGFMRNLTSGQILAQFMARSNSHATHPKTITNIVFMGQGEPLLNWKNVAAAIDIFTDERALGFGRQRITISTSGIAPMIPKVAEELGVCLAVSLHAPNDALRSRIMPINSRYPLADLMAACRVFSEKAPSATRRITFEYVMLKGVNDDPETMVPQLAKLLEGIPSHINLIPFNHWPGAPYECSPKGRIEAFKAACERHGFPCSIRHSRGADILAACGQLNSTPVEAEPLKQSAISISRYNS